MQSEHTIRVVFPVRKVSLRQLAELWSVLMSLLPEVRHCTARFCFRGQSSEHTYTFEDADELARARLAFRPGELKLSWMSLSNYSTRIHVSEHWEGGMAKVLLALPNRLRVEISGSNEGEVLAIRDAVEKWGERNLHTDRRQLWAKLGVLASGLGGTGVAAVVTSLPASDAVGYMFVWMALVVAGCVLPVLIPAGQRRLVELRIVSTPAPNGGGYGSGTPAESQPSPDSEVVKDAGARAVREEA